MKKLNNSYFENTHHNESKIDIKEVFSILLQYKKSILIIVLLGIIFASYRAYFAMPVYRAESLLKITMDQQYNYPRDFLNMDMTTGGSEIEDELIILKSYNIAKKTLEVLNIGTQYYTTKNFKTKELYKDSPFVVISTYTSAKIYGTQFKLIPIDEKQFRLLIELPLKTKIINTLGSLFISSDKRKKSIEYDQVHQFSEKIDTEWFSFTVQKIYPLNDQTYGFSIKPNESMIGYVQSRISTAKATKYGSLITLRFTDNVALRAKEIVDRVANAYIEENLNLKSEGAKKRLYFIDMQLEAINKTLEGSAEKLQTYKATNIVIDLSSKAQQTVSRLSEFESKLYETNMQIDILENILNHINTQDNLNGINIDYSQQNSPLISEILSEIQKATARYATLSVSYTEKYPGLMMVKRQIKSLKNSLKEAISSSINTLKKQKNSLLNIIKDQKGALKNFPEQERTLERLTRNFMVNEKIYSFLLDKRAETAILVSSAVSNTRVINTATLPGGIIKPTQSLIILIGLILGLLLGTVQAFLRNFLNNTIKTIEDIEKATSIPIYGAMPLLNSKETTPYYDEAMRTLWVNLEFFKRESKSKLIAFTSSVPGEGKTFTAYHLGEAIAKNSNKSVIILDLDMRRSTLHEKFNLTNSKVGMSTLLTEKYTIEEAIQETKYSNLQVITSGPKSPNPTGLIMSVILESIIETLSKEYDYILLDTPPTGLVSDTTKIMYLSDLTLILLKADYSKKAYIKEINRLETNENINLGIVLNGINFKQGYGYKYDSKYMNDYYG